MNYLKQLLLSLTLAAMAMPALAESKQITIGDICYYYKMFDEPLAWVYSGHNCKGDVTIPKTISVEGIDYKVDGINENAFYACDDITSVTIGDNVIAIGEKAFYDCPELTSVKIGNSVYRIDKYAFSKCKELNSVTIPSSLNYVDNDVFADCYRISNVYIPGVNQWLDIHFSSEYSTPSYWGSNIYVNGELLTDLKIPENHGIIRPWAFHGWESLTSVTIPKSVVTIYDSAFGACI